MSKSMNKFKMRFRESEAKQKHRRHKERSAPTCGKKLGTVNGNPAFCVLFPGHKSPCRPIGILDQPTPKR
jgi:hypothetical protein